MASHDADLAYKQCAWMLAHGHTCPTDGLNAILAAVGKTQTNLYYDAERLHANSTALGDFEKPNHKPPTSPSEGPIRVHFDHGLGDCSQFAQMLQLWVNRGYQVEISGRPDLAPLWEYAGFKVVPWNPQQIHVGWGYPWQFRKLDQPNHFANKTAHNLECNELPHIGSRAELWPELVAHCVASRDVVRDSMTVVLHTVGNAWRGTKSMPVQMACEIRDALLRHGFTVALADQPDKPFLESKGVRHLPKDDFGALFAAVRDADLVIGIDSGVFHLAGVLGTPRLGFFPPDLPPNHVCLPSVYSTYAVDASATVLTQDKDFSKVVVTGLEWTKGAGAVVDLVLRPGEMASRDAKPGGFHGGRFTYRRVGYDERPMELNPDGTIGAGRAGCEESWIFEPQSGTLAVYGKGRCTMRLQLSSDGVWRGAWIHHERMPIELVPVESCQPKATLLRQRLDEVRYQGQTDWPRLPRVLPDKTKQVANFIAGIPTIANHGRCQKAVERLLAGSHKPDAIYVIDNSLGGYRPCCNERVVVPPRALSVAGSWNLVMEIAGHVPAIILNDDCYVGTRTCEELLQTEGDLVVGFLDGMHLFYLPRGTYETVGRFDDHFPLYWEDGDYLRRVLCAGLVAVSSRCDPEEHEGSASKSNGFAAECQRGWEVGRDRYQSKWGGLIGQERFTTPWGK